jgi:hypothetical protein
MNPFNTYDLSYGSTVFGSYSIKDEIITDPEYQRHGDVWTLEKKQLLIDSLLNRYDIPKIYFHKLQDNSNEKEYAIIDGRQRLETIWKFIDGEFSLNKDFKYLRDPKIKAGGMTYSDLSTNYPKIKNQFDSTTIPIIVVDTDDLDLIEDMFSRLNEAVPLNAAEKRNAIGGFAIKSINSLSRQYFFTKKVRFSNKRFQHREVAARLLFIEYCLEKNSRIVDTKKVYLDAFARNFKRTGERKIKSIEKNVSEITKYLASIFTGKDILLAAQAAIPIYYLAARHQLHEYGSISFTRKQIDDFNEARKANRSLAEKDIEKADWELLEYDRLSQQGTNDAGSINERTRILLESL